MTMLAIQTDTLISLMTIEEAHATESEIIKTGDRLRLLLVEFYERKGYKALGYSSYTAWAEVIAPRVFGASRVQLTRELTAAVIERELVPIGTNVESIPESQLRPLATFVERPRGPGADEKPIEVDGEAIRTAWGEANYRSEGKPTARIVAQVVQEMRTDIDDELDPPMELEQVADQFPEELTETDRELLETTPSRMNAGMYTKENKEWYTPAHIVEHVIKVFHGEIDLDPCSNSADPERANVPAQWHFTQQTDGLSQSWNVDTYTRVYMNPPYGDEIAAWVDRLVQAYEGEEIGEAIALLPGRTDTNWFQPLRDHVLCFVKGRLRFSGSENSAPFPSVVVYMGTDPARFIEVFSQVGFCMRPA